MVLASHVNYGVAVSDCVLAVCDSIMSCPPPRPRCVMPPWSTRQMLHCSTSCLPHLAVAPKTMPPMGRDIESAAIFDSGDSDLGFPQSTSSEEAMTAKTIPPTRWPRKDDASNNVTIQRRCLQQGKDVKMMPATR
jgi:hypothetical protein